MKGYFTYPDPSGLAPSGKSLKKRIAVVTQGVKLPGEQRGYTRFLTIACMLADAGFEVDLITSTFQHWDKAQRLTSARAYRNQPYRVRLVQEPGYKRNVDIARIRSHAELAKNLRRLLERDFLESEHPYSLIYSEIPPNDMARVCAEVAADNGIPYVADINDLWPEAMRMALDVPVLSDLAFSPFARDAKRVYSLLTAAVGTSDEYANRPRLDRHAPYEHITVYVGNDLEAFDEGARLRANQIQKPSDEIWVIYTGTLGASYDLSTLIDSSVLCAAHDSRIRVKILGAGPDEDVLKAHAAHVNAPVDFVGYAPYDLMAAYLCASDIAINSLVADAPQSIVTKIGDYLAAGIPIVNTGLSPEFCAKVEQDGFGVNVPPQNAQALADALLSLASDPRACANMGNAGRAICAQQFDRKTSYAAIVDLIQRLTS